MGIVDFKICWMLLLGMFLVFALAPAAFSESVVLVENGRASAVILVPDGAARSSLSAAEELNYWVRRITGAELSIVREGRWDGSLPVISVGHTRFASGRGVSSDYVAERISRVGGLGAAGDNSIILAGVDDPMHAVVEFVKRHLGVRVIWPGELGEVFEERRTLIVPAESWAWDTNLEEHRRMRAGAFGVSDGRREEFAGYAGEEYTSQTWEKLWPLVCSNTHRWLSFQRMDSYIPWGRGFVHWWEEYSQDHPEWFAMHPDGERRAGIERPWGGVHTLLCLSNPEVAEQAVREWKERFRPQGLERWLTPNDVRRFCTCDNCRAWDAPEMMELTAAEIYSSDKAILTDRYVRFWNVVAEKVVKIDPDHRLMTYAYCRYEHPPLTDIKVHPNVHIQMVTGEGDYPDYPVREYWLGWMEAGAKHMYWRPNLFTGGHGMPYVFARQLGEDLKFMYERGMKGVDFDSLMGHWSTHGLNYYVASEILVRPEVEVDDILEEYYGAFGAASGAVREYFDYLHEVTALGPRMMDDHNLVAARSWGAWRHAFIHLAPLLFDEEFFELAGGYLDRAEELAAGDSRVVSDRVDFLRAGFEHSRLTARAIRDTQNAGRSISAHIQALRSQNDLLNYRLEMFRKHPQAINIWALVRLEMRRNFMWQDI